MGITVADIAAARERTLADGSFFELDEVELDGYTYPVFKHAPKTAIDVIQSARNHGDIDFLVYQDQRYTYTTFFDAVDATAASLKHDYRVSPSDRVAIAMRNNPEWLIAFTAITLLGGIPVPINSWGKTEELAFAIEDCGAEVLVADRRRLELLGAELDRLSLKVILADDQPFDHPAVALMQDVIGRGSNLAYEPAATTPEDICLILYTSGSTGFPKGVTHRNIALTNSLFNMLFQGMLVLDLEGGPREYKGGAERETPMLTVPLFHGTGLLGGFYTPLMLGQKVVMMYKWDALEALKLVEREKVTSLSTVPAILQDFLNHPEFDNYNTESMIRATGAGAATPPELSRLINDKLGNPSRSAGYAMTESIAVGSMMNGVIYDMKPAASGTVSPIMQIRCVDGDGKVLPQGEAGEFEMHGVCCTPGYWEKPEANAKTFVDGRWMKTGDVGLIDSDGFLFVTGRIKEIVIRGGENIFPGDIETIAYEIDGVHECVVFGEPDQAMGEELVMMVYSNAETPPTEAQVREQLAERLAAYKVPRTIAFADAPLPRNASEKLHKLKVKEAFLAAKAG
ncbi:MAG: class I adenylate-forming enzyme family protein [Pseudomonadota bacterium]